MVVCAAKCASKPSAIFSTEERGFADDNMRSHFLRLTCALLLLYTIEVSRRLNKIMMQVLISCGAGTLAQ
jgi:hypothetical protein